LPKGRKLTSKGLQAILFHSDGLELYVGVIDLDYYLGQSSLIHTPS